jgi:Cft2 family RNA processing exonuclease
MPGTNLKRSFKSIFKLMIIHFRHVLGAAMFEIRVGERSVVYTVSL